MYRLYDNNIATFENIDKVCKFDFGHKRRAFETMDEIGLDRVVDDLKILFERTNVGFDKNWNNVLS